MMMPGLFVINIARGNVSRIGSEEEKVMDKKTEEELEKERRAQKIKEMEERTVSELDVISEEFWKGWAESKRKLDEKRIRKNKSRWQRFKEWFFL